MPKVSQELLGFRILNFKPESKIYARNLWYLYYLVNLVAKMQGCFKKLCSVM